VSEARFSTKGVAAFLVLSFGLAWFLWELPLWLGVPLRSDAVARHTSTATDWRRPVRISHRSAAASPVAARVADPATPMRNGVGRMGSVPPENATR